MRKILQDKADKAGYDQYYKSSMGFMPCSHNPIEYLHNFEVTHLKPFCHGGNTKGFVRSLATQCLLKNADDKKQPRNKTKVLDAGSGSGQLSVYLACLGFNVIGVDISCEAIKKADELATGIGVEQKCTFIERSLEDTSLPDESIDFIIGHSALHHFIKYRDVPGEFRRILKPGARGFFADSFGENFFYHIFHNKQKMTQLGDVPLSASLINSYFSEFDVELTPTDWFVMLDKLYLKVLPVKFKQAIRTLSRLHFWLDRKIPANSRLILFLSGSVMTVITKR
jgi:ubiquinone/menaquinone biosynthesis C-methylase UbiE